MSGCIICASLVDLVLHWLHNVLITVTLYGFMSLDTWQDESIHYVLYKELTWLFFALAFPCEVYESLPSVMNIPLGILIITLHL